MSFRPGIGQDWMIGLVRTAQSRTGDLPDVRPEVGFWGYVGVNKAKLLTGPDASFGFRTAKGLTPAVKAETRFRRVDYAGAVFRMDYESFERTALKARQAEPDPCKSIY